MSYSKIEAIINSDGKEVLRIEGEIHGSLNKTPNPEVYIFKLNGDEGRISGFNFTPKIMRLSDFMVEFGRQHYGDYSIPEERPLNYSTSIKITEVKEE
ncbi:MAG: hypothetical protein Q7S33_04395 [Nanoarchaeota archaeon]|nr:hypothetical protein [Nanoarchaeota archaeon]